MTVNLAPNGSSHGLKEHYLNCLLRRTHISLAFISIHILLGGGDLYACQKITLNEDICYSTVVFWWDTHCMRVTVATCSPSAWAASSPPQSVNSAPLLSHPISTSPTNHLSGALDGSRFASHVPPQQRHARSLPQGCLRLCLSLLFRECHRWLASHAV